MAMRPRWSVNDVLSPMSNPRSFLPGGGNSLTPLCMCKNINVSSKFFPPRRLHSGWTRFCPCCFTHNTYKLPLESCTIRKYSLVLYIWWNLIKSRLGHNNYIFCLRNNRIKGLVCSLFVMCEL